MSRFVLPVYIALILLSSSSAAAAPQETTDAASNLFRGSFSPAELGPAGVEPDVAYAFALALAMKGRFVAAGEALEELAEVEDSPLHARFVREGERIRAYQQERRRFLTHLQATGRKLNLRKTELKLLAAIVEVRENEVVLGKNRSKIDVLVLDNVDCIGLADAMFKSDFPASFIAAYPYVLNGDAGEKRVLFEDSDGARALRADAESGFDGHADRAAAARHLGLLSRIQLPVSAADVQPTLDAIARLMKAHGGLDLVRERQALLRRLAAETLKARFQIEGLKGVLHGAYESLPGGAMRVTYGFNDAQELADFTQAGYLEKYAFLPKKELKIKDSRLKGSGFTGLRHILDFEGPLMVRATLRYRSTARWKYLFWLGLNDDGQGHFVAGKLDGGLIVIEKENNIVREEMGGFAWKFDEPYTLEVRYDGVSKAYASMNGKAIKRIDVGPRLSGGVFLFSCTKMALDLEELVIEGILHPAVMTRLRDRWTAQQLKDLGLGG